MSTAIFFGLISIPIIIGVIGILFVMVWTPEKRLKNIHERMNKYMHENEDMLKEMSKKGAEINSEGTKITARAVKEGFAEKTSIKFCKNCGKEIDEDSKFCNYCGKEQ